MKPFVAWVINYQKKISKSLTTKVFLVLLTLLLSVCVITYLLISLFLPFINQGQSRKVLASKSKALVNQLRQSPASESGDLFACFLKDTGADLYLLNEDQQQINLFTFHKMGNNTQVGEKYPFRFADSDKEYILIVHFNPTRSAEIKAAMSKIVPFIGAFVLLMSFLGAFFFSRYATNPIIRMSKIASQMAELDFSWYCPDLREDEIGVLAKSINELSDKLNVALSTLRGQNASLESEIAQEKERERKQLLFFSAVSHELKTPIAVVIGQLEGMLAEIGVYKDKPKYLARSAELLRSLDGLLKEILSVSYIDIAGKKVHEPVNLSDVLISALEANKELMASRSISLTKEIEPNLYTFGDKIMLKKAFENVLGNSAVYSPMGSSVQVRLTQKQDKAILTVTNSGAHIPEEHLSHLFEPFYRVNRNSTDGYRGSGLGLYITRTILENHNTTPSIENCHDGVIFTAELNTIKLHTKHTILHPNSI